MIQRQRVAPVGERLQTGLLAGAVALSWLGEYVHNRADLPRLTLLSPENSIVALIALGLFLAWWRVPQLRRATAVLLLAWGLLHLIGGGLLSVLPLGFLPFAPEQSLRHYLFHLVYGAAQLPLIAVALANARTPPRA